MDENQLQELLMQNYNDETPFQNYVSTATAGINNQTRKRVKDLLSKYSTTGLGRSGIGGAAMNDIYSNAGQNISQVGAQAGVMESQNRSNLLNQMLGLYEYQDQKPGWGDVLGGVAGALGGSMLGPIGNALGGKLSGLLRGGSSGGQYAKDIYGNLG